MGRAAVCAGGRRPASEIATREPDGSEWSISRPALALPPPTGTAARPRWPRGGPLTWWCCLWLRWCFGRRRARPPARLGGLTSFGAAPRSPAVPSGPSGALHTCGAWCADGWLGASSRSLARPRRHCGGPPGGPTWALPGSFACNSPWTYCLSVSLHVAESLLFGNCMRLWGGRAYPARRN